MNALEAARGSRDPRVETNVDARERERQDRIAADAASQYERGVSSVLAGAPFRGVPDAEVLRPLPEAFARIAVGYQADQGGVMLLGATGVGKTRTAVYLVRRLLREATERARESALANGTRNIVDARVIAGWCRAVDLGTARSNGPLGSEPEIIRDAKRPRVLIIDDLGWESQRDTTIPEIIAHRYDRGLQTIVTSGLTAEQLRDRYGEAVIRRILESGGTKGRIVSLFPKEKP